MKLFGAVVNYVITGYDYANYGREVIGISESEEGCIKLIEKYKYNITKHYDTDEIHVNTDDTLIVEHEEYSFTIKEVKLDTLFEEF